jgi:hypothetical protein
VDWGSGYNYHVVEYPIVSSYICIRHWSTTKVQPVSHWETSVDDGTDDLATPDDTQQHFSKRYRGLNSSSYTASRKVECHLAMPTPSAGACGSFVAHRAQEPDIQKSGHLL